jgi:uncharacterized protein involved in type VI secretion and phage assembly
VSEPPARFFGKYRGLVLNNVDPMRRGRLMIQVPDVSELAPSTWAEPCFPCGGMQFGIVGLPMVGAGVWVEYEQGDPDYPIWTGTFFGNTSELPALSQSIPPGVPGVAIGTPLQSGIVISDVPGPSGGIMIKGGMATITINDTGVILQNGKGASVTLTNNQVIVNAGALVVT